MCVAFDAILHQLLLITMKRKSTKFRRIEHLTNTFKGRVKFNEVDSLGIVWHGHYIGFFEEGREAFGREYGLSYLDIKANDYTTPIVNLVCDYKYPLRYGEIYMIRTFMVHTLAAKIILQYEIYNETNKLVCEGQTTQAFVDLNGNLALYSPKFYQDWKTKVKFE